MKGLIYRAVANGYDRLRAYPEQGDDVEVQNHAYSHESQHRARMWNRVMKIRTFENSDVAEKGYDWTLYLDGSLIPKEAIAPVVDEWLADADFALFRHPHRNCPFEELKAIETRGKATRQQIRNAEAYLKFKGAKPGMGLFACGALARRYPQPAWMLDLQQEWLEGLFGTEMPRDQPFLPLAMQLHANMGRVKVIDADIFNSPWLTFHRHGT